MHSRDALLLPLLPHSKAFCWLASILLGGCSLHYRDASGTDHYWGMVSVKTPPDSCMIMLRSQGAGLTLDTTSASGGLIAGYRSIEQVFVTNNQDIVIEESEKPYGRELLVRATGACKKQIPDPGAPTEK